LFTVLHLRENHLDAHTPRAPSARRIAAAGYAARSQNMMIKKGLCDDPRPGYGAWRRENQAFELLDANRGQT
jgi:hypothetical protein